MKQLYRCLRATSVEFALTRFAMASAIMLAFVIDGNAANTYMGDTEAPAPAAFVSQANSSVDNLNTLSVVLEAVESGLSFADMQFGMSRQAATCSCPNPEVGPELSIESEDFILACGDPVPPMPVVTATDDCDPTVDVISFPFVTNPGNNACVATDAIGANPDYWSVFLPVLNQFTDQWRFSPGEEGSFVEYDDNTALITGSVRSIDNPNRILKLHIKLVGNYSWPVWNAMMTIGNPQTNRIYKDQYGFAAMDNNFEDFGFYEIDPSESFILGEGDFEGAYLLLDQAPSNRLFGAQVGQGANDVNGNYGLSTWFTYTGFIPDADGDLIATSGQGDVNLDLECGAPQNVCVENTTTYTYIAIDDCGNYDTATLNYIELTDMEGPELAGCPANVTIECGDAIPAPATVTATDACTPGAITVDYFSNETPGSCPGEMTIMRTWSAVDACGNSSECSQTITVVDTTAPTIVAAADMTIECGDDVPAPAATADDSCNSASWTVAIDVTDMCGDTYTEVRTYTATDECGNTATDSQTITVVDTTAPTVVAAADMTIECGDAVPAPAATADDSCGDATWTVAVDVTDMCGDTYTEVRTYTATDDCGNTATDSQTITIVDTTAPSITAAADMTIECGDAVPAPAATADDSCGDATWAVTSVVTDMCGDTYTEVRTYTATDDCGNTATDSQTITVVDTTAPTIVAAADMTIECGEAVPAPSATADDSCGDATWTVAIDVTDMCGDTYTEVRTYTATDDCGNTATDSQTITIVDTTAPSITAAADMTIECGDAVPAPAATADDSCGDATWTVAIDVTDMCGDTYTEVRTYTATDDCGNTATDSQTITVVDTEAPVFGAIPPFMTVECDDIPAIMDAPVSDACGDVTVTGEDFGYSGGCEGAIERVYTATDECGNTNTYTQIINVIDTTAPVITGVPADMTIECGDDVPTATVEATDNCSDVTPVMTSTTTDLCGDTYSTTYTYTATDECDNSSVASYTLTVVDTTAPTIVAAADMTIECGDAVPAPSATADDSCGDATWTVAIDVTDMCGDTYTEVRTYTATDDCGNTATDSQTITVVDTTAPTVVAAADMTIECGDAVPAPAATAADSCGDATWTVAIDVTDMCGDTYTEVRTYTATDDCGNTATDTQTITIVDTTAPSITAAADMTIECGDAVPAPSASADDSCGDATWTVAIDVTDMCGDTYTEVRTYTATDDCGNTATDSQTITVVDTTAPSINAAANITVNCDETIPAADASASDSCGDATWTVNETFAPACGETGVYTRVYTATDDCGNTATATQIITIVDTEAPVIVLPAQTVVDITCEEYVCDYQTGLAYQAGTLTPAEAAAFVTCTQNLFAVYDILPLDVTDNCDDVDWEATSFFPIIHDECTTYEGSTNVKVTFICWFNATDDCGNAADSVYTVLNIVDNTAPVFAGVPADTTAECDNIDRSDIVTVSDDCDILPFDYEEIITNETCPGSYTLTRTWSAIDECGNSAEATQVITVVDTTPPTITAAADETIECGETPSAPAATVADNCGDATWTVAETFAPDCGETGVYTRVYTATDDCGNTATDMQTITIVDTTIPEFGAIPPFMTVECDDIPAIMDAPVSDTCGDVTVTGEDFGYSGGCEGAIERIYTATDECGNTNTYTQIINVIDTTAPVITGVPADMTIECGDAVPTATVEATDNCSDVTPVMTSTTTDLCGDTYSTTYTYTATDDCDNSSVASYTLTVVDTTAPTIVAAADMTIECGDAVPAPSATADDSCGDATWTVAVDVTDMCGDTYTEVRTYTATDECNNTATATQTITVVDTTAPTIVAAADMTIECGDAVPAPSATADDSCGDATWTVAIDVTDMCGDTYTEVRTYTATDECNNTATDTQTITIVDTTAPSITAAADMTIECGDAVPAPSATADDSCGDATWTVAVDVTDMCGDTYTEVRTYTATDDCGNTATDSQTITIVDTTAPTIVAAADMTIECGEAVPAPSASADDSCGDATWTVAVDVTDMCGDTYTEVRTYTATDECNNTATDTQTITVVDTTPPTIVAAADMTIECGDAVPAPSASADDSCGDATWTVAIDVTDMCGDTYTEVRTYTATDECNNTATATQTITVVDTTPPTIVAAADMTIECGDAVPAPSATADDSCGDATWTVAIDVTDMCGDTYTEVRTYTATDDCGNTATDTQTITIVDTTAPTIVAAADMTIECGDAVPAPAATAADSCGDATWTVAVDVTDMCGDTYTEVRTYTATDDCGNTATDSQTITVVDTTAPSITSAPDYIIECGDDVPVPSATATDTCGDATWTVTETFADDCGETGVYTRIYTATDECGNTATDSQTVTVVDTTAPTIVAAADMTIECGDAVPAPAATADDSCGDATWTVTSVVTDMCGDTYTEVRTYTATDDCGNTATDSQTITVVDTTAPTVVAAADMTIECGDAVPAPSATADDSCGDATWAVTSVVTDMCGDTYTEVRTYTATDDCGNTATDTQTITVVDTTAPTVVAAADMTIECGDAVPAPAATADDSCGDATWTVTSVVTDMCGDTYTEVRTYTATDDCGNTATDSQTITVVDTTAPTVVAAADMTIECGDAVPAPSATADDSCGDATWTVASVVTDMCGDTYTEVRTYTATDDCGNTATDSQTITIVDTTAPTVVAAADMTIECGDALPAPSAIADDSCGDATWTVAADVTDMCGETFTMVRTYTATDDCGNTATDVQTLTIVDTTAPTVVAAADMTIECGDAVPAPSATADDSCGDATWTVAIDVTDMCGDTYTEVRTYTATDDCGNTATDSQTITIVDTTAPTVVAAADMTIECGDAVPAADATADDSCGDATWTVAETFAPDCGETGVYTRVYTATDDCGNTATDMQTITIVDTTIPEFGAIPPFMTVECDDIPAIMDAPVSDTCGDVTVTGEDFGYSGGCEGAIERIYTATDECGNTNTYTQIINVIDTTAPVITGVPADMTIECGEAEPTATVTATDNCSTVTPVMTSTTTDLCGDTYSTTYTYTATDDCDNSSVASYTLTVVDTTAPTIVAAADMTIECGDAVPAPSATADDSCGDATWAVTSVVTDMCGDTYTEVRTYTATDECGNTATDTQTITIVDTTAPTIVAAADMTIECGDTVPAPSATADDSCGDATWTVDVDVTDMCGDTYTEVRTYTATDDCGNTATDTQTITIVDTTAPSITAAADMTIECGDAVPAPSATADDSCGDATWTVAIDVTDMCGDTYTEVRTYTATDDCGNTATDTQTITVVDTTPPSITVIADMTIECGTPVPVPGAEVSDTCGDATYTFVETYVPGCGETLTCTQVYTATDECGNTATATRVITIVDTTAPTIVAAADMTIECGDAVPAPSATADDSCGDATWTVAVDVTDMCGDTYTEVRTYTATDECGNTATDTQTITIVDTTAPTIVAAADMTIECGDAVPAPSATADDSCGDATWAVTSVVTDMCGDTYTEVRTYTATDECGNTATDSQTITVVDTTAPTVVAAADMTIECGDAVPAANATASDSCGDATWTVAETFAPDCGETGVYTRVYTATDDCGNTSTDMQTITIVDTTIPEFGSLEPFITAECDAIPTPAAAGATDNCGAATVTVADFGYSGGCEGAIERIYTATDDCGNTNTYTQIINVIDTTDPVIVAAPADMTIECPGAYTVAVLTATDNCGDATVTSDVVTTPGSCPGESTVVITWTAVDECNNTSSVSQTINIVDTTAPVFDNAPSDMTVDCQQVPAAAVVTAMDLCSSSTVAMTESTTTGCPYTITRTYTATDECNNAVTHVQTITVVDNTAPTFSSMPADMTVECDNIPTAPVVTATDNCDDDIFVSTGEQTIGSGCVYTIERTWTATDACNNVATHTQTITVTDTTAPQFIASTVPADVTVECDAIPAPADPNTTDNCSNNVTSQYTETEVAGSCDGEKVITRTWVINDGCGNTNAVSQTITVIDTTAPMFTSTPSDETYTCGDVIPDAPIMNADDNCSQNVTVTMTEDVVGNDNPNYDCELSQMDPSQALSDDTPWSMFLEMGGVREYFELDGSASFTETNIGGGVLEGHITGTVRNNTNSDEAFMIDVYLIQKTDYAGWTSQLTINNPAVPRAAKTFNGVANSGDELDWDFWLVDASRSQLVGIDDYAGDILSLTHAPMNLYYAFEVGMNANNYSDGFGLGGWFRFNGTIGGVAADGQGDIAFTADCPPCEYTVTRTWTATDNCGNSTVTSQLITVNAPGNTQNGNEPFLASVQAEDFGFVSAYPNPTGAVSNLVYRVPVDTEVVIEVLTGSGKSLNTLYNGAALSGVDNYAQFDGSTFDNGMYLVRLTTGNNVYYQKVMLNK